MEKQVLFFFFIWSKVEGWVKENATWEWMGKGEFIQVHYHRRQQVNGIFICFSWHSVHFPFCIIELHVILRFYFKKNSCSFLYLESVLEEPKQTLEKGKIALLPALCILGLWRQLSLWQELCLYSDQCSTWL